MTDKKDSFYAKTAFYLSLGFWVPLFNIVLCTVSVILAWKAINLNIKEPKKYGGRGYAITALVLGGIALILTIIYFLEYYVLSSRFCGSAMCQAFLATQ